MSLDPVHWMLGTLVLFNLAWIVAVNWVWKKLPKSNRIHAYCILLSGPLGWIIFLVGFLILFPKKLLEPASTASEDERDFDQLDEALRNAQQSGLLFDDSNNNGESLDKFDDPDFDWESHEFFENLKRDGRK